MGTLAYAQLLPVLKNPELLQKPSSNLILTLRDPLDPIYKDIASRTFPNREARLQELTRSLQEATQAWHAPVLTALKPFNVEAQSFWVTNQISVKNANPLLVRFLRGLAILREIAEEIFLPILPIFNPSVGTPPNGTEWGVRIIGSEDVWSKGNRGEGVRVGVIDTGVRASHVALRENYVGAENNGWYDPILRSPVPTDNNGHGTHCTGSICGNNGIGVAPNAKWMACRGCDTTGCPQAALLACGQWVICPTNAQGQNPDCSKAPHIVSNSWGGAGGATWFNDVIKAWNAAKIIGFFAIGNDGPACSTAGSPGDQQGIISVGSTNINDTVSSFSSRGPKKVPDGQVAPLIVAPGENINSAYHVSDNGYQVLSGTSMATPHAAGAAALLLSGKPGTTLEEMMNVLYPTTNRNLGATGSTCGNNAETVYPNDVAGNGRIDVSKAFSTLTGS
ncbi:unnamed protein product [Orchesella dallaii]|uniref:Peptidase S8/S53 domain-containing protein n=1 Tax=Orchesella dallaii TaxID=48710 RepID=A0ABP1S5I1_9HEXA